MLAERTGGVISGSLGQNVLRKGESLYQLLEFVETELSNWAERPDRTTRSAEAALTSELCSHLNSASQRAGWDFVQFRTEVPDEAIASRKIDLAISPCNAVIEVNGRSVTDLQMLLPIECKRLPTPKLPGRREETEYVFTKLSTTGGIQRFKDGHHGANHSLVAMIGFVQEHAAPVWLPKVLGWIDECVAAKEVGWTAGDHLVPLGVRRLVSKFLSRHDRRPGLGPVEIRHYWLDLTESSRRC